MGILRLAGVFRPVRVGWGGEVVCGRDAAGGSRHGGITSGTVGSQSVLGNCGVGRQRNGNRSADPNLGHASDMRRRNTSGENGGQRRPSSHRKASPLPRLHLKTPARGHAADGIPRFFAAVPAVMSHGGILLAPRRRIAATTAERPCAGPKTANVSGCGARRKRADSSAAWSISQCGPNAVKIVWHRMTIRRNGRRCGLIQSRGILWVRSFSIGAMATGA
jgi:hypothetical protein